MLHFQCKEGTRFIYCRYQENINRTNIDAGKGFKFYNLASLIYRIYKIVFSESRGFAMFLSGDTAFYEVFSNLISRYHNVVSP